jgi:hypothetical protein
LLLLDPPVHEHVVASCPQIPVPVFPSVQVHATVSPLVQSSAEPVPEPAGVVELLQATTMAVATLPAMSQTRGFLKSERVFMGASKSEQQRPCSAPIVRASSSVREETR